MKLSSLYNNENINIVRIISNGSEIYIFYVDGSDNLKQTKAVYIGNDKIKISSNDVVLATNVTINLNMILTQASGGWDVNPSTLSYDSDQDKDVSGQEGLPRCVAFNNNGTKMFIVGSEAKVFAFTLTTAYNPSTASRAAAQDKDVSGQESDPQWVAFNNDGTKMFIVGKGSDTVRTFTLTTAYNPSTASHVPAQDKDVSALENGPTCVAFNNNGTKMFIMGSSKVRTFTLTTAYNPSTASHVSAQDEDISGWELIPTCVAFNGAGTKMFILGAFEDTVFTYTLSTPWNPSTAFHVYAQRKYVRDQEGAPDCVAFSNDGSKMFIVGAAADTVFTYV